ncbi:MAG: M6 family metalloprotease domain-containing protein [Muribaculum sp.]|nr:M6 family metalloprotease domain-containing protein [Muribaculum sp.]
MKRFLPLAMLMAPALLWARPADPRPATFTNPDGTTVKVRCFGDEHFNYFTDLDANYIYELDRNGFWNKAVRNGRVLTFNEHNVNLLRAEVTPVRLEMDNAARAQHRMAALDKDGRTTYPTVSDQQIPALVVLWEFADTPFSFPDIVERYDKMLNEENYSDFGAVGSARDYYLACSNGKFNVHFDVAPVVKLKYARTYYNGNDLDPTGTNKHRRIAEAIQEAIEQLDPVVDFSKYDLDKDGFIDNIFFFHSGFGQADSHDIETFWPHQGSYYNHQIQYGAPELLVDGVRMRTYACSNELNFPTTKEKNEPWLDGIGAFCHEYGHVLGLPDLYDIYYTGTKSPGIYTIMDHGSYNDDSTRPPLFSAYEKWLCRWLEYEEMEAGKEYTVNSISVPADNQIAYKMKLRRPGPVDRYFSEYFLFETRHKTGWDSSLPEEGMFIWRINYSKAVWEGNQVNVNGNARLELMNSTGKDKYGTFAWPGANNIICSIPSQNPLTPDNVVDGEIWLTNIEYDVENHATKFGYNVSTELPDYKTVLHDNIKFEPEYFGNKLLGYSFNLEWDEIPEATDYMVTVTRRGIDGKEKIVDGYDEKKVGKTNTCYVANILESQVNDDFEAYVRVFTFAPSSEISNVVSFKSNLGSGVGEIFDYDAAIYGGNGEVIAPEAAEVYNVNGVNTGKTNLVAGVYIVRYGDKTVKVVVK